MIKSFLAFLGGEPGEEKPILLLLGMGFFMGIFLATYQIGAETLFINELGEDYLDQSFFIAGFLGIVSTLLFVSLQKRINFSSLVTTNTFMSFVFVGFLRLAFLFAGDNITLTNAITFLLFVMIGPITAINILGFWGVFGRIFDLRASKRIIGGIDTGTLVATILTFFLIPFIQKIPGFDTTYDLLTISAFSSLFILVFCIWIIRAFNIDSKFKAQTQSSRESKEVTFKTLLQDPYLRLLSLFLFLSMAAVVFLDYSFYSVLDINFPKDEEDRLRDFLSFFNGTVMIMSFIIQSFVNDFIINKFGLKVALMTMPIILILFMIGGIVSGHVFGYEFRNKEFLFFFMFTVSGKAFTSSLKDALENPAFKLFFLPIDIKIRFDIQTRIEGVVNETATLIAGAIQIGMGLLTYFNLIHYSYFIIALAGGVIFVASKLFIEYKVTLKKTLEDQKVSSGNGFQMDRNIISIIQDEIDSKNKDRILTGLIFLEKIDPIRFEIVLLDLVNSRFPEIRKYAYSKLGEFQCFNTLKTLKRDVKTEGNTAVLDVAIDVIEDLEHLNNTEINDYSLRLLVRSTKAKNRIKGARLLANLKDDSHLVYLLELLRDINMEVRIAAIITAGKLRRPELWPLLIENLHHPSFGNAAASALAACGQSINYTADTAFYKTGQFFDTMYRSVQLFGRIGGKGSVDLLWKKIDFPDKKIVSEILLSLSYLGFNARDFQVSRIKVILESELGDIAWNLKTTQDIPYETALDGMIKEAFLEEDKKNYQNIFMLLSMIYDRASVQLVKENISIGTSESITFAVEMLDVFVDDELKPKLFPVLDDLKVSEKLAKLNNFFPPEDFSSYQDLLRQIINRDYNRINRYTKSLAIYRISQMEDAEVSFDLIANLFNPDYFILETAAFGIFTIDEEKYHLHTKRLKIETKKLLDKAILPPVFQGENEEFHQKMLLIERVLFLKNVEILSGLPGELITYLAEFLEEQRLEIGTSLVDQGDQGDQSIYFIIEGAVDIYLDDELDKTLRKYAVVGYETLLKSQEVPYTALTRNQCTVFVLAKDRLLDLMSKYVDFLNVFLNVLNKLEEKEEEIELSDVFI